MGLLYHRPSPPAAFKVMLATPARGAVEPGYAYALADTVKVLEREGIQTELCLHAYDPHVDHSRNVISGKLLESDCTDLFFLDADLRWEALTLASALAHRCDVLGAIYPLKQAGEGYTIEFLDGQNDMKRDRRGLVEIGSFATGFMRIRRNVIEKLAAIAPWFWGGHSDKAQGKPPIPWIFERALEPTEDQWEGKPVWRSVGGDINFCRKARAQGFRVWIMPDVPMEHIGAHVFKGNFGAFMQRQANQLTPEMVRQRREAKNGKLDPHTQHNGAVNGRSPQVIARADEGTRRGAAAGSGSGGKKKHALLGLPRGRQRAGLGRGNLRQQGRSRH